MSRSDGGPRQETSAECQEALSHLYHYIDEQMALPELTRMRTHLDTCPGCLHELDVAHGLRRALRRSCTEEAPGELRDRVAARIAALRQTIPA
jgi:anti-sigma factor (TIGR02949 family)